MSHLTTESLARLVDESPGEREQAHLAGCSECRTTLDAMRAEHAGLHALGAEPQRDPPAEAWGKIMARVEADREAPLRRSSPVGAVVRAAAAIVLFAAGAATGVYFARSQEGGERSPGSGSDDTTVNTIATASSPVDIALARLRIAELMYTNALLDYAKITSPEPPKDAAARLATLETIVLTTRMALERAPADPLINSYHLAALAERETLLGQLRRTPEAGQWY